MWETNISTVNIEYWNKLLKKLTDEEIESIVKFITIRKLSGKWPYDTIKEKLSTKVRFFKYFDLERLGIFAIIYTDWEEYAKRDRTN